MWRRRRAEAAAKRKTKVEIASEDEAAEAPETEELEKYAEDDWQAALLDVLKGMKANAFERLARLLLLSLNFSHVEVVGRSGDGGIDLLGIDSIQQRAVVPGSCPVQTLQGHSRP